MRMLPSPVVKAPGKSLLKRTFGAFFGVVLLAWCALMAREIYDVKVVHARNGQAWNHVWAEHVRLQTQLWLDQPERLQTVLAELERLRAQEWQEMGYEPPIIELQVWQGERMIHRFGPQGLGERSPPDVQRFASDDQWLYVEARAPEQGIVVRRWQEVPGAWHFSLQGLAYYARPLFYSLPLMLAVAWLLLRAGFGPLRRMAKQIARRSAKDLSPLHPSAYVELAPVVNSVNALMTRLQDRLEREREFLLDAAHELKTPLAVIQLNAESLQQSPDAGRRAESTQRLVEGVRRATHTVHQLLALARSGGDTEAMDLREHDLVALARDRILLASQLAVRRNTYVELLAPESCRMQMNRESMGSLIDNLVDNAVKYSPPDSRVLLQIDSDDDTVRLSVADQGPGIPPALHQKVFERFFRGPDQEQPGSGLGLAIVERVAALHGASISLSEGLEGHGLSVLVSFPRLAGG
ncbi:MAG: two-component sensor histidine kinase [Burkholderiaceae bacterium]|nr:two-component sensor histidine kinase [Burkholderiaceae bacterium]